MKTLFLFILSLVLFVQFSCCSFASSCGPAAGTSWEVSPPDDEYTLKALLVVLRHGARVPQTSPPGTEPWDCSDALSMGLLEDFPTTAETSEQSRYYYETNIPERQINPGTCLQRQLTKKGYLQLEELGKAFKKAYFDTNKLTFTSDVLSDEVFVRYDYETRTKFSAQGFFNGVFPESEVEETKVKIVDIFAADKDKETMLPNPELCPSLANLAADFKTSEEFTEFFATQIQPLVKEVSEALKWEEDYTNVFDFVTSAYCHDKTLPLSEELLDKVSAVSEKMFQIILNIPSRVEFAQLTVGLFAQELATSIEQHFKGSTTKFEIYSSHDLTIASLLSGLNLFNNVWPPFASFVSFDLVSKNEDNFVRVNYNGDNLLHQTLQTVYIPVEKFLEDLRAIKPTPQQCGA